MAMLSSPMANEGYWQGLWVTQAKNGAVFTKAFLECQSVILFFSINKSHCFQGFVSHLFIRSVCTRERIFADDALQRHA